MKVLSVTMSPPLYGEAVIHGAKNSALPILAACCCCQGTVVLHNCPDISDVANACTILQALGCSTKREGSSLTVAAGKPTSHRIPQTSARAMRASVLFSGALLSACGEAFLAQPGGCPIGARPIDLHIRGFEAMGADLRRDEGLLHCRGPLHGGRVVLTYPSVGATENLMLAALHAEGETEIRNAAMEPEIADLARFLNCCGANVRGAGTNTVVITPTKKLSGTEYTLMPDRMETATYLCACAGCGGEVCLRKTTAAPIAPVVQALRQGGCRIEEKENALQISRRNSLSMWHPILTGPYPAFPTDAQPMLVAAFLRAGGETQLREGVFPGRFLYAGELQKLGGSLEVQNRSLHLLGSKRLSAASLTATDLRAAAALLIGAMQAEGASRISGIEHLLRGYDHIENQLRRLGADVKTVEISNSL